MRFNVGHDRQPAEAGTNLAQEFEALVSKIDLLERQPAGVAAGPRQARDEVATDRVSRHGKNDRAEKTHAGHRPGDPTGAALAL